MNILNKNLNIWPTIADYRELLKIACARFDISENEARKRFGLYTYAEWMNLLTSNYPPPTAQRKDNEDNHIKTMRPICKMDMGRRRDRHPQYRRR